MKPKKRQMMLIPEVNPASSVFFYERGNGGKSWSIRDYSHENSVKLYGPKDYAWTAGDVHLKAKYSFDAEKVHVSDLAHWHGETRELNSKYLQPAAHDGRQSS